MKKSGNEKNNEDNSIKITFEIRYEAVLTIAEIIKDTSKINEKDIKFEESLTVKLVFL